MLPYFADGHAQRGVLAGFAVNLVDRVDGGGVVFAAQLAGDLRETQLQLVAQHVHGDLARHDDVLVPLGTDNILERDLEVAGRAFDDLFGAQVLGPRLIDVQQAGGDCQGRLQAAHFTKSQQLVESALKFTNVVLNIGR